MKFVSSKNSDKGLLKIVFFCIIFQSICNCSEYTWIKESVQRVFPHEIDYIMNGIGSQSLLRQQVENGNEPT